MNIRNYKYNGNYFSEACHPELLKKLVLKIHRKIKRLKIKYDSIACRGMSGLIVAAPLSCIENKPITIIRKELKSVGGEAQHHDYIRPAGFIGRSYIIIDDFIGTGDTIRAIVRQINNAFPQPKVECKAIILYSQDEYAGNFYCNDEEIQVIKVKSEGYQRP